MYFSAFLVFLLAALSLSCPPPLNNFDFMGNDTHTSSELIEAHFAQAGLGWVEGVTVEGNTFTAWPRDEDSPVHSIHYCFWDKVSFDLLPQVWIPALQLWEKKLDSFPSKETYHAILFTATYNVNDPQYCNHEDGKWNDVFPLNSLIIMAKKDLNTPAAATRRSLMATSLGSGSCIRGKSKAAFVILTLMFLGVLDDLDTAQAWNGTLWT